MRCTALVITSFLFAGLSTLAVFEVSGVGVCKPMPRATEIGDRATCPFTATVDVDPNRIPTQLPVVKCNCRNSICSEKGDFRCHEVRTLFRVAHRVGGKSSTWELTEKTLALPTSCVCVVGTSSAAHPGGPRTPVIPVDETDDCGTCPFTATVDVDPNRIPAQLPVVKCKCPGSVCGDKGDFRCQEVRSVYNVAYRVGGRGSTSELTNKTLQLPTSCVCASQSPV